MRNISKSITFGLASLLASFVIVMTLGTDRTNAAYVLVGCKTWFSGNSTYAKCGSYDKYGKRIYSYNAFAMCRPIWGSALRYSAGNYVYPYETSRANCEWYEKPVSAGVNIR